MSRELYAEYERQWLFPPALEDFVPPDHPARFVREFVESLDLESLGFRVRTAEGSGRPAYSADLLLKVWLYGYMRKIRSTRELERECREQLGLVWLCGLRQPDHSTLWRFFRDHRGAIERLFGEVVRVALRAELVGLALHALDGTKILSCGSSRSLWHKDRTERLLEALERSIARYGSAVEDAEQEAGSEPEMRLPEELQDREALRERVRGILGQLEAEGRRSVNEAEPEAQVMKCDGQLRLAYNAQATVDRDSGLIVAQDVSASATDQSQLVPMLERVEKTVGQVAERTVADAGYCSGLGLAGAHERGYGVMVNLPKTQRPDETKPFARPAFTYDAERDVCVCPRGEPLPFYRTRDKPGRGYTVREYRCQSYRECPVRSQCSRDRQGRRIEISPHDGLFEEQRALRRDPQAREHLRQRRQVVEPVFGWIKQAMGFRRFTHWGLESTRAQWALVCTAVNLNRLVRHWQAGTLRLA